MKEKTDGQKSYAKEYILCFPPGRTMAGNFFSQMLGILCWEPVVRNAYVYSETEGGATEDGAGDEQAENTVCLFMECAPKPVRAERLAEGLIRRKIKNYMEKRYPPQICCEVHRMQTEQDYPYGLRLHFVRNFMAHIVFDRRTRIGVIEGNALMRKDLITLLRQYYDRMNYLTIFSKEPDGYVELAEDAWEQYGLAVTVTANMEELRFCDYILDCTTLPFEDRIVCRKDCIFFAVCAEQKKIRSMRKMGEHVKFDSCFANLDRAFHNKV